MNVYSSSCFEREWTEQSLFCVVLVPVISCCTSVVVSIAVSYNSELEKQTKNNSKRILKEVKKSF